MSTQIVTSAQPAPLAQSASDLDLAAALREAAGRLSDPSRPVLSSDDARHRATALVKQFLETLEMGDLTALGEVVCDDVVYRIPGHSRISGVFEGVEGIVFACSVAPRYGAQALTSELVELIAGHSGDQVATFHTMTGLLDGNALEIDMAMRFELRDNRISSITEYSADQYATDDLFGGN